MVRKFVGTLLVLSAFAGSLIYAVEPRPRSPDYFTQKQFLNGVSTTGFRIDYYGNVLPGRNLQEDIGSSTQTWRVGFFGRVGITSGTANHEVFVNLPSSSTFVYSGAGGLALSTSIIDVQIGTPTLSGAATGCLCLQTTTYSMIDFGVGASSANLVARNVVIYASASAVFASSASLIGNATFYGIDVLGKPNSEMIAITTNPAGFFVSTANAFATSTNTVGGPVITYISSGSATVTNSSGTGIGFVPFIRLSSVTIQISSATGLPATISFMIGTGNRIGIANVVASTADIYNVVEGSAAIPITSVMQFQPVSASTVVVTAGNYFVDLINNTIQFLNPPTSGRTYQIWYINRQSLP